MDNISELSGSDEEFEDKIPQTLIPAHLISEISRLDDEDNLDDEAKKASISGMIADSVNRVRQQGSKFLDRLRINLRRKSETSIEGLSDIVEELEESKKNLHGKSSARLNRKRSISFNQRVASTSDLHSPASTFVSENSDDKLEVKDVRLQLEEDVGDKLRSRGYLLLIDTTVPVGKALWKWSRSAKSDSQLSPDSLVGVKSLSDVQTVFSFVLERLSSQRGKHRGMENSEDFPLKLCLCGSDEWISGLASCFVDFREKAPRSWRDICFYVIPLDYQSSPYENNRIAEYLANADHTYRSLFSSFEWRSIGSRRVNIQPFLPLIERNIHRYLTEATSVFRLPIASALVERNSLDSSGDFTRVNLPFLRDLVVRGTSSSSKKGWVSGVLVDYWVVGDNKGRKHQGYLETKNSLRGDLFELQLLRTHHFPHDLDSSLPEVHSEDDEAPNDPVPVSSDIPSDPLKEPRCLLMKLKFAPKDKRKSLTAMLGTGKSPRKLPADHLTYISYVSKVVLSSPEGVSLRVDVDGVSTPVARFISVSPQWSGREKAFPVASFP